MRIDVTGVRRDGTYDSLLRTIGFVVVQWGHCEQSLELLINTLFREYEGKSLRERKRMPRPVSEKIAFLRECAVQIASLASYRAELESLAESFERVMKIRHDLVHGALTDKPVKDGVFTLIRLEAHPEFHEVKEFIYDLKDFPALEASLIDLGTKTMTLARRIFDARPIVP